MINIWSYFLHCWMYCQVSNWWYIIYLHKSHVYSSFCRNIRARFFVFEQLHTVVDLSFGIYAWNMHSFSWIGHFEHNLWGQFGNLSNRNIQKTICINETLQHFEIFRQLYLGFRHSFISWRLHQLHGTPSRKAITLIWW